MDSVAVLEHPDGNRTLLVNNRFTMGGTGAALAERRHGSIALLLHPDPKRALFLGLGTGITFAAAGPHQDLRADGVELVPEIVEVLPWFEPQNALPNAPDRFRVFVADARRFVQVCPETYDVIVADLFHPARDGAGALYSLEHFQAIRRRLTAQGIFCQWLPLFQLDEPMLRVVIRTFLEAFPNTRAFLLRFNVDTPVIGLVGTMQPRHYGPDYFKQRVRDPNLREHLDVEQLRDAFHLFGCFLAGPEALRRYSAGAALNTDDHPVVLFGAPAANLRQSERPSTRLLHLLEACSSDSRELIEGDSPEANAFAKQLSGFIHARNLYLQGLTAEAEGNQDQAMEAYLESARISPLFPTGYAHILTIAMQQARNSPETARRLLEQLEAAQPDRPAARQLLQRLFPAARP
jgi:spermidine synthase